MALSDLRNREFRADATTLGERVTQGDAPDLGRDLVGHQMIKPGLGACAPDLEFRERGQIDDADTLAHRAAFIADMLKIIAAPETPLIAPLNAGRCEPGRPLPAKALAPHCTHAIELVVDRRGLGRTSCRALLVREVNREDIRVGLLVLLHHIALGGVITIAARIGRQHVDARLALGDPLSQLPAGAAGGCDTEAVTFVEPQIARAPGRPDQRAAIRGVGNRSVDNILDATVLERRHATDCCFDVRQQAIEIALKQALSEPLGDAIGKARRGAELVGSENPAHALLAQVIGFVRFAQHRELAPPALPIGFELRGLIVDDVLVLDRNCRHVDAKEFARLARVVTRCADHVLAHDLALVRGEEPLARGGALGLRHLGLLVDLRAAGTRAFAQRHRQVSRGDVTIVRVVERANQLRRIGIAAHIHQRPQFLHLRGRDDLERHADRIGGAAVL